MALKRNDKMRGIIVEMTSTFHDLVDRMSEDEIREMAHWVYMREESVKLESKVGVENVLKDIMERAGEHRFSFIIGVKELLAVARKHRCKPVVKLLQGKIT